ncbi:MAG: hypothetical protein EBY61_01355, partial [Actinobacteria bacterium]|nr:hypothetical protein [Actinomycetota bacterium]
MGGVAAADPAALRAHRHDDARRRHHLADRPALPRGHRRRSYGSRRGDGRLWRRCCARRDSCQFVRRAAYERSPAPRRRRCRSHECGRVRADRARRAVRPGRAQQDCAAVERCRNLAQGLRLQ